MRKVLSLLLVCWLPLFFSATVLAASDMQVGQALGTTSTQTSMPCHQPDSDKSCQQCDHCGLCANFAIYLPVVLTPLLAPTQPPASHVGWVASPTLTLLALRPPIVS